MKSLLLTIGIILIAAKSYHKDYYDSGNLKSQGWLTDDNLKEGYWIYYHKNGQKQKSGSYYNSIPKGYWYFYNTNGAVKKEGHFEHGKKNGWWIFYNNNGDVIHKCQLHNGKKDGYCLKYKDNKIQSAQRYNEGIKIKEWYDFSSFRKENDLSDLK